MSAVGPRFLTDPDHGGTEKLTVSLPRPEFGLVSPWQVEAADVSVDCGAMAGPHCIMFVKGWSRSLAALTICLCAYEQPEFLQALDALRLCSVKYC